MALKCKQCGVMGSVVDTICRNCGVALTNSMPAINNFSYNSNPNNVPSQWNGSNYPQSWQPQNQNNLPPWQGQYTQPPQPWVNQAQPYPPQIQQQYPYPLQIPQQVSQPYPLQIPQQVPSSQSMHPQMSLQRWSPPPNAWGQPQPQQVFIINNVHPAPVYQERKSPAGAALLSVLLTGCGQLYNGQVGKGLLMLGACIFLWSFMLGWVISIWSIVDAYSTAKKMNSGQQV